jgi:7-cyano-7-deazaguanine synthase
MLENAVVLFSGGLDSTTCLALAISRGFRVATLSFSYGQRHSVELDAAKRVLDHYGIERRLFFDIGLFRAIGGSALTSDLAVPQDRTVEEMESGIPVTYVPARNLVFLSYALGVAETENASDIFIGVNALDYAGYPDCRPEFIRAFEHTANLATKAGAEGQERFVVHTPLLHKTKADIVRMGTALGAPFHLTHSCYSPGPGGLACGICDACQLRLDGFRIAGVPDPIRYASPPLAFGQM